MTSIRGIDISSHQPTEDWPTLYAQGIRFAAVKLCGGTSYTNPEHAQQIAGARAQGIVVIHYHYGLEPTGNPSDAITEAHCFVQALEAAGGLKDGEGLALDLEEGSGYLADWAYQFLCEVEHLTGVAPFLYTYPSFINEHGLADPRLARFPLWFASYRDSVPPSPGYWARIAAWQYSDNESIPGVGHVDGDCFFGTVDDLRALGKRPPASAAPAVDPGFPGAVQPDRTVQFNGVVLPTAIADQVSRVTFVLFNAAEGKHYQVIWDGYQWSPYQEV